MGTNVPYNETLLQWLWKERYLQSRALFTENGKKVHIHHPGYLNASDGPDFTNARITIGALKWHGDVEIHWRSRDWLSHNHHTDKNFNSVILHVVYDDAGPGQIYCQDETMPPTLQMKPFLPKPLQYFFRHFRQPDRLPCAGNIKTVPESILAEQFEQAHREYFDQKTDDLLQYYKSSLPLSKAWQRMLIITLFDGLGISHNRKPMRKLARLLLNKKQRIPPEGLVKKALNLAGIEPKDTDSSFVWKRKGSRPANHPKTRIQQACKLLHFIKNQPFSWWLRTDLQEAFEMMLNQINTRPAIGSHQSGVLFGTVWLPAFYILGDLTGTVRLRTKASNLWLKHRTSIPKSITKYFYQADMPPAIFEKKLGSVHQYRSYCNPHKCQQCKVFNKIISS